MVRSTDNTHKLLCIALNYYYFLFSPKILRGPQGGPKRGAEGGLEGGSRFCLHPYLAELITTAQYQRKI